MKWYLAGAMGLAVLLMAWRWFSRDEIKEWMHATWDFRPPHRPAAFRRRVRNRIRRRTDSRESRGHAGRRRLARLQLRRFVRRHDLVLRHTLTEIPIVEMLTRLGMGKGPALALLLAGPALSLPSILVIYKVVGFKRTLAFCFLAVAMSTLVGWLFGTVVA